MPIKKEVVVVLLVAGAIIAAAAFGKTVGKLATYSTLQPPHQYTIMAGSVNE